MKYLVLNLVWLMLGVMLIAPFIQPIYAQQPNPQQPKQNCIPHGNLPIGIKTHVMNSNDGDIWYRIKTSTGKLILGYMTKGNMFCIVDEGKDNPES